MTDRPRVPGAEVSVWAWELDGRPHAEVGALADMLDDAERAVVSARSGVARERYVVAHGTMRALLARVLAADPRTLRFDRDCEHCGDPRHGRPRLAGVDLSFSLSHSGPVAVLAVAPDRPVGVDVEVVRARPRLDALARRVLVGDELAAWQRRPPAERLVAFLGEWTRREAYAKATGLGVYRGLGSPFAPGAGWCVEPLPVGAATAVPVVGSVAFHGAAVVTLRPA